MKSMKKLKGSLEVKQWDTVLVRLTERQVGGSGGPIDCQKAKGKAESPQLPEHSGI